MGTRAEKVSDKLCKEYAEWENFLFFSYIVERWYLASLALIFYPFSDFFSSGLCEEASPS